ncbi:MAG: Ldh family oxidoreductase [Synergistetes bacterium]|nr:Ldh family oxidoreductase [Synergistota bacterium]MDW8192403.1 Ldh family oxidoreductase [Synergistota bacterium]
MECLMSNVEVKMDSLRSFCSSLLSLVGVPQKDAELFVDSLIFSELRGVKSHGIARLPVYIKRINLGLMNPKTDIREVSSRGAVILADAGNGIAPVVGCWAIDRCIELAGKYGVGVVGVRNSNHLGSLAYYVIRATKAGMIGLAISNTAPAMAPWGGKTPLFGTNPIAIGIPAKNKLPIVLDMATSVVARGRIRLAALKGEKIPLGWAIDENGLPTDDPVKALKGTLLPIGGPKGYGLALIIDLLSGLLTGSAFLEDVGANDDFSKVMRIGHLFMVLDPSVFVPGDFETLVDDYIRKVKSSPTKEGERIYMPGEIEFLKAAESEGKDVLLTSEVLKEFKDVCERIGASELFNRFLSEARKKEL